MNQPAPIVLPLAVVDAPLERVGGKSRSLAKLLAAELPVPDGFVVSTTAYRAFVDENELQPAIEVALAGINPQHPASLDRAADEIRSRFEAARLLDDLAQAIATAYAELGSDDPPVAVRSSATAEDLPELSFAGQQDTYLNVRGRDKLLAAVQRCWASLWTARAIGYRERMHVDHHTAAMGVVVQPMVAADVSGILFTANPATGDRAEFVVNASFGLGEAIVGGQVTPDTIVLRRRNLEIKQEQIGDKATMIVAAADGGTTTQPVAAGQREAAALPPQTLRQLGELGLAAEQLFDGQPQDIEWAVADGQVWLLQSRPITNLPPPPLEDVSWDPPYAGAKLIRRQVVENMPGPLSPLFAELYLQHGLEQAIDRFMIDLNAPFQVDDFMNRPWVTTINGFAYTRADFRMSRRLLRRLPSIIFWYVTALRRLIKHLVPRWRDQGLPNYLETIDRWKSADPAAASDEELLAGVRELTIADAKYWFDTAVVLGMAKMTDAALNRFLATKAVRGNLTSGMFLRGFPSKTLDAQSDLEAIAQRIHGDESLRTLVANAPAGELRTRLEAQPAGRPLVAEIDRHLAHYGHRVYTLDFAEPTQLEDPLPVLLSLKSLAAHPGGDTGARQAQFAHDRHRLADTTAKSLDPLRRWLFRKLLKWAQTYGPYREEALFYMGAAWPTLRSLALELGARLVRAGTLATPDDVFYLTSDELSGAGTTADSDQLPAQLGRLARERRELRDARQQLHPPAMVPQRSRFKIGPVDFSVFETQQRNVDDAMVLKGFAVSPGKVTGPASVILAADDFDQMRPGTILVCPTTTPAWTPLLAQASGLATDIGGILAHGSIVAREYGIPAVLGTGNLTKRIASGQQLTVDGDAGTVTLVEANASGDSRPTE